MGFRVESVLSYRLDTSFVTVRIFSLVRNATVVYYIVDLPIVQKKKHTQSPWNQCKYLASWKSSMNCHVYNRLTAFYEMLQPDEHVALAILDTHHFH